MTLRRGCPEAAASGIGGTRQLLTMEHMTLVCDGLLVEYDEGTGECDLGDACQALGSRDDYPAYRAAHGRVIDSGQFENKDEYGGEA
jgi:hypothetical protein